MKKLLALLMALAMVFTFAACGSENKDDKKEDNNSNAALENNNEIIPSTPATATEAAEKAANEFFTKIKTASGEEIIELAGNSVTDIPLSEKDVAIKLFESLTSKFDYKVLSSEQISGTLVNVKIEFTTVNAEEAVGLFFGEMLSYAMSTPNATEDEIAIKSVELMTNAFNNPQVGTKTFESTVEVKLVNGEWTIEFNDDLFNTITGDMNGAIEDLTNQLG